MTHVRHLLRRMPGADDDVMAVITDPKTIYAGLFKAPQPSRVSGPVAEMDKLNANRRAALLINIVTRVGRAKESDGLKGAVDQLAREETYARMHIDASQSRERAARRVATAQRTYGNTLGWKAVMDKNTSVDCAQANGRNFDARFIPAVGYPGSAHPTCRCYAVAPFPPSAKRVEDLTAHRQDWKA